MRQSTLLCLIAMIAGAGSCGDGTQGETQKGAGGMGGSPVNPLGLDAGAIDGPGLDAVTAGSLDAPAPDVASVPDVGLSLDGTGDLTESIDGQASCPVKTAGPFAPRAARSLGYAGTLAAYSELYNTVCTSVLDCAAACTAAGGTRESCEQGSECAEGTDKKYCLPPTYWRYEKEALVADGTSAELTLVAIDYQDPLFVGDFGVELPSDVTIRGIQFDVLRSADAAGAAVDDAISIRRDGQPVGPDHKKAGSWPQTRTYAVYGGPRDTWEVVWTPADVQSRDFGVSIAARYTKTAGNARANVDYVRVWVSYTQGACP